MLGQFHGLPLHALIVHGTVVLLPVTALVALAFGVPRWRRILRWPLLVLAALSVVVVLVTRASGETLKAALGTQLKNTVAGTIVADHETLGTRLVFATAVLLVVAVVAVLVLRATPSGWVRHLPAAALAVTAAVVLTFTVQTGEAGAKAAWNPAGNVDYSGH